MAFAKKINKKNSGQELCFVCRKPYTKGMQILNSDYHIESDKMCKKCYNALYANKVDKFTASLTDDPSNIFTHFRPADTIEKPVFGDNKFPTGYEYVMPELTAINIVSRLFLWIVIWLLTKGSIYLGSIILGSKALVIGREASDWIISLISAIFAVRSVIQLLIGVFHGIGYPRRLLLIGEIVIYFLMFYSTFPLL